MRSYPVPERMGGLLRGSRRNHVREMTEGDQTFFKKGARFSTQVTRKKERAKNHRYQA